MPTPVEVYRGSDSFDAHVVRARLESCGIPARVDGEAVEFMRGEVPFGRMTGPRVLVDDGDAARALALVAERPDPPADADDLHEYRGPWASKRLFAWGVVVLLLGLPLTASVWMPVGVLVGDFPAATAAAGFVVLLVLAVATPAAMLSAVARAAATPPADGEPAPDEADLWTNKPEIGRTVVGVILGFVALAAWCTLAEGRARGIGLLMATALAGIVALWWRDLTRRSRGDSGVA